MAPELGFVTTSHLLYTDIWKSKYRRTVWYIAEGTDNHASKPLDFRFTAGGHIGGLWVQNVQAPLYRVRGQVWAAKLNVSLFE